MLLKENIAYLKYFGVNLTFWKTLNKLLVRNHKYNKTSWKIHDINNEQIERYLKKTCPNTYTKLLRGEYDGCDSIKKGDLSLYNNVIWTMWWQGEENAPEIVKKCINSMRRHCGKHRVIVLDANNYKKYVNLPEIIDVRVKEKKNDMSLLNNITLDQTKISDIIRMYLLYYYGGVWTDATVFFSKDVDEELFNETWYTLGQDDIWYIGRGRWSSFFMGAKAGLGFIKFIYDMHIEYWSNKKYYVNYLMIDHMFDIASKERTMINNMVQNNPCKYTQCLTVNRNHDKPVDENDAKEFFKNQIFHKLSWRWWGRNRDTKIQTFNNKDNITWIDYLLKNYDGE